VSRVAADPESEHLARQASSALYNTASAVVLAWEGGVEGGDPRKQLISRFVLEHRVEPVDPLAPPDGNWEHAAYTYLLDDRQQPTLAEVGDLLAE
jgi:acyl-CoA dehydrogenase